MNANELEGSLVLEKLASMGLVEDFLEAVDADDLKRVVSLMRQAEVDEETMSEVIRMIDEGIS